MTKARVLYIEDDSASRRLVDRLLSSSGFTVFTASDGIEGVALAHQSQPNLILMDINLPHMNGRALTTRLRSSPTFSEIPIVALTAHSASKDRKLALAAGCTGFLTKPIDVDVFPQQVQSFLNGQCHKLSAQEHQEHLEQHTQELVRQLESKIRELEQTNQRMQELNALKSDFLRMASQDLIVPLDLTKRYLNILSSELNKVEDRSSVEDIEEMTERMNRGLERMNQVRHEIEHVSDITSGLLELKVSTIHIGELVADVVADYSDVCQKRKLHLFLDDMRRIPYVKADATQLQTAVSNIVSNAIKYTPDGGYIYISTHTTDRELQLAVQDSGLGIPATEHAHIFEPFYALGSVQNHSTSKYAYCGGGLGLGLPMAKGIIEAHNGRILVESFPGDQDTPCGSTFTICLPLN